MLKLHLIMYIFALNPSPHDLLLLQVTQQEVHRAWCCLRERQYTQDLTWLSREVARLCAMVTRLLLLNDTEPYLSQHQQLLLSNGNQPPQAASVKKSRLDSVMSKNRLG